MSFSGSGRRWVNRMLDRVRAPSEQPPKLDPSKLTDEELEDADRLLKKCSRKGSCNLDRLEPRELVRLGDLLEKMAGGDTGNTEILEQDHARGQGLS